MTHALKNVSRGGKLMPEGLIFDGYLTVKNLDSIDTETPLEDLKAAEARAKAEHDAAVAAESTAVRGEEKISSRKGSSSKGKSGSSSRGIDSSNRHNGSDSTNNYILKHYKEKLTSKLRLPEVTNRDIELLELESYLSSSCGFNGTYRKLCRRKKQN